MNLENLDQTTIYIIGMVVYLLANHFLPPGITKYINIILELIVKSGQTPGGLKIKPKKGVTR